MSNSHFDNGLGGVERIQFRENVVVDAEGTPLFSARLKQQATTEMLARFSKDKPLSLIYPIPEVGWNIYRENVNYYSDNQTILQELRYPFSTYKERNQFALSVLDQVSVQSKNIVPIRADVIFCQNIIKDSCVAQLDGQPLYLDDDHVSDEGAELVVFRKL